MDSRKYQLRSRSVPPSGVDDPLDRVQGVHTPETEGITQTDVGEGLQGRISPGLMAHGISTSTGSGIEFFRGEDPGIRPPRPSKP